MASRCPGKMPIPYKLEIIKLSHSVGLLDALVSFSILTKDSCVDLASAIEIFLSLLYIINAPLLSMLENNEA